MDENELDFTELKYVLYARKSTDDPRRQVCIGFLANCFSTFMLEGNVEDNRAVNHGKDSKTQKQQK